MSLHIVSVWHEFKLTNKKRDNNKIAEPDWEN